MEWIKLEASASAAGVTRTESAEVPFKDGVYPLPTDNYPFNRFQLLEIRGDEVIFADLHITIGDQPTTAVRHDTAYSLDKVPWAETMTVTVSKRCDENVAATATTDE